MSVGKKYHRTRQTYRPPAKKGNILQSIAARIIYFIDKSNKFTMKFRKKLQLSLFYAGTVELGVPIFVSS